MNTKSVRFVFGRTHKHNSTNPKKKHILLADHVWLVPINIKHSFLLSVSLMRSFSDSIAKFEGKKHGSNENGWTVIRHRTSVAHLSISIRRCFVWFVHFHHYLYHEFDINMHGFSATCRNSAECLDLFMSFSVVRIWYSECKNWWFPIWICIWCVRRKNHIN